MNNVRILIACGSGIATSTVAQEKVKEVLKANDITATITKGTIGQIPALQEGVDIILVTTPYRKPVDKPIISVFNLISGINEQATAQEIVDACRTVMGQ